MKRRKISGVVRWLLVTLVLLIFAGGGAYAYVALTSTGEVTVEECLSFVGPSTFSVTLYPLESQTVDLTIANASSAAIEIDLISTVIPDPGPKGLTITVPKKIIVPAVGQVVVTIDVDAGKNAEPGVYQVSISIDR